MAVGGQRPVGGAAIAEDAIPDIEYTALMSLTEFEEQLSEAGVSLWLAALNETPFHVVERAPLGRR